jgi:hypothetical protein
MRFFLGLLLTLFLVSCTPSQSSQPVMTSPENSVQTDLALLANRIRLPENVSHAQWITLQRGLSTSDVPAPTDITIYAVLKSKNGDWSSLPDSKSLLPSQRIIKVPVQIADKLFLPEMLKSFQKGEGYLQITGKQFDPNFFNQGSYQGVYAILVQDDLLVCLQSR